MWTQSLHGLIILLVFLTVSADEALVKNNGTVTKKQKERKSAPTSGEIAQYGDVPYIAFAINWCQGVILSPYNVLTYGPDCWKTDCIECEPVFFVKVGSINICEDTGSGHNIKVKKVIRHPINDLVIYHTEKIVFNEYIKPIRLSNLDLGDGESTEATISGWEGEFSDNDVSKYVKIFCIMCNYYLCASVQTCF